MERFELKDAAMAEVAGEVLLAGLNAPVVEMWVTGEDGDPCIQYKGAFDENLSHMVKPVTRAIRSGEGLVFVDTEQVEFYHNGRFYEFRIGNAMSDFFAARGWYDA